MVSARGRRLTTLRDVSPRSPTPQNSRPSPPTTAPARTPNRSQRTAASPDAAVASGKQNGAAAELNVAGHQFVDVSGSSTPLHPLVQEVLDSVPPASAKKWHGGCAELRCVSRALDARVGPSGGTMIAVQVGDGGLIPHGATGPPCPGCEALKDAFGYGQ